MLKKLTRHISTLAIRVLQFLSYPFSFHFSSSAFSNLNFRGKKKKRLSLGDCKSMAESPWASACPTPPPPPPVILPVLVFSSYKVFSQLSLFSLHPHHCRWRCLLPVSPPLVATGSPLSPSQNLFSLLLLFIFNLNYFDDQSCMILFGFEKQGFWVWLNVL